MGKRVTMSDALEQAIDYIVKRSEGTAPSLITPFDQLNNLAVDGIPWGSHFVIGARSGVGKTLIKDQILNAALKLNPHDNIKILDFSFEMPLVATGLRIIQAQLKQDKSTLLSTQGNKIPKLSLEKARLISKSWQSKDWAMETDPLTVKSLKNRIMAEIVKWQKEKDAKIIIAVDHSLLIKAEGRQSNHEIITIYGETITDLRKHHNITVFTLSQLNRNIEEGYRKIPGKPDNFPQTSDISTADALLQHADFLAILNRPSDFNLKLYGPEKWIVPDNKTYVAMHLLKNRSGEQDIIHLKANYQNYEFNEMTHPPESKEAPEAFVKANPFKS